MRSMRLVADGQDLEPMEIEIPRPGLRSVLVKVTATGVCHTDLHLISGAYDMGEGRKVSTTDGGKRLPLTPGHEIAGSVESLGTSTEQVGVREGDRVIVYPWIGCGACRKCLAGKENVCEGVPAFLGFWRDGGYAEYVLVPEARYLVKVEGMDPFQSATLACSGLTAFSTIRKCDLRSNELILVIGAGGLGTAAIQIAKKTTEARVAVADLDDSKLELAAKLGADYTFNTSKLDAAGLASSVKRINQGRGADAVADFVGNPGTVSSAFRLLGREGRLVLVGQVGGAVSLSLPLFPLRSAQIVGNFTGTLAEMNEIVELARSGTVTPVVTGTYRLEEANEVLAKLGRGEITGRAVLKP
jgi:alcohol dehydrogenase, propanol-preferring